jgi:hypothetical protein
MLVEIRFLERPNSVCSADANRHIDIRSPTSIDVYAIRTDVICEGARAPVEEVIRQRSIQGIVLGESGAPLKAVRFSIYGLDSLVGLIRRVNTDDQGRFVVTDLPVGTYSASFYQNGLSAKEFRIVVSPDAPSEDWTLTLRRDPGLAEEPPAVVTAADVPVYPASALEAGVSGTVNLRVSLLERPDRPRGEFTVTDIDAVGSNPALVQAAKDNVSSWRFANVNVPVLAVTYVFRLAPGDCSADQRPVAFLRFPGSVEIVAKRRVPCFEQLKEPLR